MFTGLVEGCGTIDAVIPEQAAVRLVIEVPESFTHAGGIGDSVAVNGCCLTVVERDRRRWSFQAGTETLSKTTLGKLRAGDRVNLERPLRPDGELGGHFVQGHIDGVGEVVSVDRDDQWVTMWFRAAPALTMQMVPKGSIAIDGVSLTLVKVTQNGFSVALIPHTLAVTTLGTRQPGDAVNLETDILAKYVQKMLPSSYESVSECRE